MHVTIMMMNACRLALFMCQADGSLAIAEVQGSSLPSKPLWVHPKNKSQAVSMVLLAADGGPLFPPGAHMHLTWPNNNMITAAQQDNALSGGLPGSVFPFHNDCIGYQEPVPELTGPYSQVPLQSEYRDWLQILLSLQ